MRRKEAAIVNAVNVATQEGDMKVKYARDKIQCVPVLFSELLDMGTKCVTVTCMEREKGRETDREREVLDMMKK